MFLEIWHLPKCLLIQEYCVVFQNNFRINEETFIFLEAVRTPNLLYILQHFNLAFRFFKSGFVWFCQPFLAGYSGYRTLFLPYMEHQLQTIYIYMYCKYIIHSKTIYQYLEQQTIATSIYKHHQISISWYVCSIPDMFPFSRQVAHSASVKHEDGKWKVDTSYIGHRTGDTANLTRSWVGRWIRWDGDEWKSEATVEVWWSMKF